MAYFDTKSGSLEEAIRQAVGGKINEKVEYVEYKFKNKNDAMKAKNMLDGIQLMGFDINDDNISNGEISVDAGSKDMTKYHKEVMKQFKPKVMTQEKLDPVNPKAAKKKFDDRKDKDIDNDGDVDSSDKFLHKRRKAIGKAMQSEVTGKDIAKKMMGSKTMKSFASKVAKMKSVTKGDLEKMLPDYVAGADISKLFEADDFKTHMMYDPKTGKGYEAKTMDDHLRMKKMGYTHDKPKMENYDIGTPENTKAKLDATPGQSSDEWNQQVETMQKKNMSMREALAKMWGVDEGHNPFEKKEGKQSNPDNFEPFKKKGKKEDKTMTGKPTTKVSVDPDMKEKKN